MEQNSQHIISKVHRSQDFCYFILPPITKGRLFVEVSFGVIWGFLSYLLWIDAGEPNEEEKWLQQLRPCTRKAELFSQKTAPERE